MNKFHAIRDFLWVLQAFLRGVLYQKTYRPQGDFFRPPGPASVRLIKMLMGWWGFRPATMNELIAFWNTAGNNDKRDTLVSFDPEATTEHMLSIRGTAGPYEFDSPAHYYCDAIYYNGVSLEEQQRGWGRGGGPSFGTLSRHWGHYRFLAVRQ